MRREHERGWAAGCLVVLCWLSAIQSAQAFHAAQTFADGTENGGGGGGGVFYTGAPQERGWTCAACHLNAQGKLRVLFSSKLFGTSYTPGAEYAMRIRISNESQGLAATRSNYNGMVLRIADSKGAPAGRIKDAPADIYYVRSNSAGDVSIVANSGMKPRQTEWTFTWAAPAAGKGPVSFHLGVVDGNGGGGGPDDTVTDPFNDDVFMTKVSVNEGKAASGKTALLPSSAGASVGLFLALGCVGWFGRGRRR
jgi:hypothetical protein